MGGDPLDCGKIGCTGETPRSCIRQAERDKRENGELRQANEIPRKALAYFARAELDRPFKR